MRILGFGLITLGSCFLTVTVQARHALYAVTPAYGEAGGFNTHIAADPRPGGAVKFRVVITEDQTWFNAHPLTEIGVLKSTQSSRSIEAVRKLDGVRNGKTLTCEFTVDRKSLEDPDFCFLFSNFEHAIDDKVLFLVPADFVFARLKDFVPKRP